MNADRLLKAVNALYLAGRWTCEGLSDKKQAALWEEVRDAAGIPKGTEHHRAAKTRKKPRSKMTEELKNPFEGTRWAK